MHAHTQVIRTGAEYKNLIQNKKNCTDYYHWVYKRQQNDVGR